MLRWNIHDDALNIAKDYFNGNFAGHPSPIDPNASCQNNYIIVISDGAFNGTDPSNTTLQLYQDLGIKTYMVGFALTDDPGTAADELAIAQSNWSKIATNGQTETVLYADNEVALINVLRDAIAKQSHYFNLFITSDFTRYKSWRQYLPIGF